jgi:uncharacterized iron-regulated membrane protein
VIGVVLAIIVIVGLVVGIYLCRRRSRHEKSRSFFIGGSFLYVWFHLHGFNLLAFDLISLTI